MQQRSLKGPVPCGRASSTHQINYFTKHRPCPVYRSSTRIHATEDKPDFIESLVGKLFGQKALDDKNPGGMKRLTVDDTPEMWPAVTDEFAAPLPTDTPEITIIRPLLAKTQMETAQLRKAYDSDVQGWSCAAFHQCVDAFGATLLIGTTQGGAVIGGYNPRGFLGLGEERDSIAAFLFTWPDGNTSKKPIKLPKVGGASLAVIDKPDVVQFGAEGLTLLATGNEQLVKCRLGTYYANLPSGGRTLFSSNEDAKRTQLVDLRAYVMVGEGEVWEMNGMFDIVWKTKIKN